MKILEAMPWFFAGFVVVGWGWVSAWLEGKKAGAEPNGPKPDDATSAISVSSASSEVTEDVCHEATSASATDSSPVNDAASSVISSACAWCGSPACMGGPGCMSSSNPMSLLQDDFVRGTWDRTSIYWNVEHLGCTMCGNAICSCSSSGCLMCGNSICTCHDSTSCLSDDGFHHSCFDD